MVIAVDFDGTISASRYPDVGEAMPGAIEGMQALKKLGCYLILWTCRTGKPLEDALIWLNSVGIEVDRVNTQEPGRLLQYGYTRKVDADLYVDDKVVGGFPGWERVVQHVWEVFEREVTERVNELLEKKTSILNSVKQ